MEVQEYRLWWNVAQNKGYIDLRVNGKWSNWQEYDYQNFTAAAQILQNERPVYADQRGFWTGSEKPGE